MRAELVSHRAVVLVLLLAEGPSTIAEFLEHIERRFSGLLLLHENNVRSELDRLVRDGMVSKSTTQRPDSSKAGGCLGVLRMQYELTAAGRAKAIDYRQVLTLLTNPACSRETRATTGFARAFRANP